MYSSFNIKGKKFFLSTGVDLSRDSIKICRYNANKLGVGNRIKLLKSDVDNLIFRKYDLIVLILLTLKV